jgi:parallel beta-helix repeat protein
MGIGIFVQQGATATISGNKITKIHDSPIVQCAAYGIGILVGRAAFSTTGTATISGNTISDYQKSAIEVDNTGSTATITGNTITGWSLALQASDSVQIAQNGIQISRGAVATITSNNISTNECPNTGAGSICGLNLVTQTQATGMLLYSSGAGTSVTKNTVSGNDIGIFLEQADPTTIVSSNTVINDRYAGMVLADGTYTASSNTLKGLGTNNVGIAAMAFSVNTSVTLSKNTISGFTVASIEAYAGSGLTATILSS